MQKYEILGIIGQGAYGVVLRCRNTQTKQIVAIKKFKQSQDDEIVKKTTMRQVKVLRIMNQENIVQLKQAFRKKGTVCLVFQYVNNNLLEVLQKFPSGLQPELIRIYLYQLFKGLAYLHSLNIIHRDVKPQNLLISQKKVLKICDFGFAKLLKKNQQNEQLTDYVATRWYRPPQLLVGSRYGKQIDIWGVGCIFGQLIDGIPMFPGENQIDQLFLIQKCLGSLTPDQKQTFLKNQRFLGMKFPEINSLDTIQKRYLGKLTPKALNFLKSLLKMNPKQRLTSIEALKHPYFDGLRQQQFIKKISTNQVAKTSERIASANINIPELNINSKNSYQNKNEIEKSEKKEKLLNDTLYQTRNGRLKIKRKEEITRQIKIQNFKIKTKDPNTNIPVQSYSKSVNKNVNKKFIKQKTISVEKSQNNELLTKTQGGFYLQSIDKNQTEIGKNQEIYKNYGKNKIYNIKNSPNQNKKLLISKVSSKGILYEQIIKMDDENTNVYESIENLATIGLSKIQKQENVSLKQKQKNTINIVINNTTYNYKTNKK